jgi:hypothetical protein
LLCFALSAPKILLLFKISSRLSKNYRNSNEIFALQSIFIFFVFETNHDRSNCKTSYTMADAAAAAAAAAAAPKPPELEFL